MKHITNIKAVGIKSKAGFSHDLHPVTIITGPNAGGKTAIADAVKIAVLGYHPALGKQPGKTITLAPDKASVMETAARFSDGTGIERSFKRTATGASVKVTGDEIEGLLPAQLHFEDFLAAKATERQAILSRLMGKVDTAKLTTDLTRKVAELGLGQFGFKIDASVVGNPLTPLVEAVGESAKEVGQSVKQARATLATLVAGAVPAAVDADALREAQDAVEATQRAVGTSKAVRDEINRKFAAPWPAQPHGEPPSDEQMAELELRHATLTEAVAKQDLEALRRAVLDAQDILLSKRGQLNFFDHAAKSVGEPPEMPEATAADVEVYEQRLFAASGEKVNITMEKNECEVKCTLLLNSINSIEKAGKCPCCGSEGDHLEVALTALKKSLAAVKHDRDKQQAAEKEAEHRETLARKELDEATVSCRAWTAYRAALAKVPDGDDIARAAEAVAVAEKRVADAGAALADASVVKESLTTCERDIERMAASLAAWHAYWEAKNARPSDTEGLETERKHADAVTAAESARSRLAALQADKAAYDQAVADQQRIADLTKQADEAETTGKNLKTLKEWLREREREATVEAMGPLLKISQVFLDGVLSGELAVQGSDLGVSRDGQFIPLEVLSGMECAAVAAACQAAMASVSSLRLVIVDELGRMTDDNAQRFLANCGAAVEAGIVDQAILLDPHGKRYGKDVKTITIK